MLVVKIQSSLAPDQVKQGAVIEPGESLTVNLDFETEVLNISQHSIGTHGAEMFNGTSALDLNTAFYQEGAFYKHKDGGLYKTTGVGKSTADGQRYVIYQHVFPFVHSIYLRPLDEWTRDRFELLDFMQATEYQGQDRYELQTAITARRETRKAAQVPKPDFTQKTDVVATIGYDGLLATGFTLQHVDVDIEQLNETIRAHNEWSQEHNKSTFSGDADDIHSTNGV